MPSKEKEYIISEPTFVKKKYNGQNNLTYCYMPVDISNGEDGKEKEKEIQDKLVKSIIASGRFEECVEGDRYIAGFVFRDQSENGKNVNRIFSHFRLKDEYLEPFVDLTVPSEGKNEGPDYKTDINLAVRGIEIYIFPTGTAIISVPFSVYCKRSCDEWLKTMLCPTEDSEEQIVLDAEEENNQHIPSGFETRLSIKYNPDHYKYAVLKEKISDKDNIELENAYSQYLITLLSKALFDIRKVDKFKLVCEAVGGDAEISFYRYVERIIKGDVKDKDKLNIKPVEFDGSHFEYANESRANFLTYFDIMDTDSNEIINQMAEVSRGRSVRGKDFMSFELFKEQYGKFMKDEDRTWLITAEQSLLGYHFYEEIEPNGYFDETGNPEYICKKNSFRNTFYKNFCRYYTLTYVLLLHQKYSYYKFLYKINNQMGMISLSDRNIESIEKNIKKLEDYQEKLFDFDRRYSFSVVSDVVNYQMFYDANREVFGLRKLHEDLDEPLSNLGKLYRRVEQDENRHRDELDDVREKKTNGLLGIISIFAIVSVLTDGITFIQEYFIVRRGMTDETMDIIRKCQSVEMKFSAAVIFAYLIVFVWIILGNRTNKENSIFNKIAKIVRRDKKNEKEQQ